MSDIRFSGVAVYPHVVRAEVDATMRRLVTDAADRIKRDFQEPLSRLATELGRVNAANDATDPDIDALADTLLALDGLQQCDLAAALARRDPRIADSLSTTIGDAVAATRQPWCEVCNLQLDICRGHDDYRHQVAMAQ